MSTEADQCHLKIFYASDYKNRHTVHCVSHCIGHTGIDSQWAKGDSTNRHYSKFNLSMAWHKLTSKPLRTCIQINKYSVDTDVHSKTWSCNWKRTNSLTVPDSASADLCVHLQILFTYLINMKPDVFKKDSIYSYVHCPAISSGRPHMITWSNTSYLVQIKKLR